MGCYNGSCFLTGLPIYHGEQVRVFIVQRNNGMRNRNCYPTDQWIPLTFSFCGEYNDYGSVENQHGIMLDFILNAIKNNLVELQQGENECHDIPVLKQNFDFDLMMEANHEGRLMTKDIFGETTSLKILMVRQSALDKLLARFKWETYRGVSEEDRKRGVYYREIDYTTYCQDVLADAQEHIENETDSEYAGLRLVWKADRLLGVETSSVGNLLSAIMEKQYNDLQISYEDIIKEAVIVDTINKFLMNTRRTWSPPSGEGSQDYETGTYKMFAQLLLDECEVVDTFYDDDDDDE
jgi:hypothetical protein